MKIEVEITREALVVRGGTSAAAGCGAIVEFAGVVRGDDAGGIAGFAGEGRV
jgi:molybdopterin synthase catalytic subunit